MFWNTLLRDIKQEFVKKVDWKVLLTYFNHCTAHFTRIPSIWTREKRENRPVLRSAKPRSIQYYFYNGFGLTIIGHPCLLLHSRYVEWSANVMDTTWVSDDAVWRGQGSDSPPPANGANALLLVQPPLYDCTAVITKVFNCTYPYYTYEFPNIIFCSKTLLNNLKSLH